MAMHFKFFEIIGGRGEIKKIYRSGRAIALGLRGGGLCEELEG